MLIFPDGVKPNKIISDAVEDELLAYALEHNWKRVTTVSDSNTYPLIGQKITSRLQSGGITNIDIILNGNRLTADESSIMSVLTEIDIKTDALVAVGAGTITDIVRFVSHRLQKNFTSVPTAPSIDGYLSTGVPLNLKSFERSITCHAPSLIIISPSILTKAPRNTIIAGFGNIIGKVTAVADWELAHLLMDVPFDRKCVDEIISAYSQTVEHITGIARRRTESIMKLFEALSTSGEAIRRFGSSESAFGSAYHISRFLELHRSVSHQAPILHGIRVGVGTVISAQWYRLLRSIDKKSIVQHPAKVPDYEKNPTAIGRLLGESGTILLEKNTYLSTLDIHRVSQIRRRLIDHWDDVQRIAEQVPEPEYLAELIEAVGGPKNPNDIGITAEEIDAATRFSHYIQSRFTVRTLLFTLGIPSRTGFNSC